MKTLLIRLYKGGIRVAKTMTTWSIVLGFVLAEDAILGSNLYNIANEKGAKAALQNPEYFWFVSMTLVFVGLAGLFIFTEWKQNTKAEKNNNDMIDKLNKLDKLDDMSQHLQTSSATLIAILDAMKKNTEELSRINNLTVKQAHNKKRNCGSNNQT